VPCYALLSPLKVLSMKNNSAINPAITENSENSLGRECTPIIDKRKESASFPSEE